MQIEGRVKTKKYPIRLLNYFGCRNGIALLKYTKGGFGASGHILIFKFDSSHITHFWAGNSKEFGDMVSKEEIIDYLKSLDPEKLPYPSFGNL